MREGGLTRVRVVDRNGPPRAESPVVPEEGDDGGECMYEGGSVRVRGGGDREEREREGGRGAVGRGPVREGLAALLVVAVVLSFSVRAKSKLSLRRSFVLSSLSLCCVLKIEILEARLNLTSWTCKAQLILNM